MGTPVKHQASSGLYSVRHIVALSQRGLHGRSKDDRRHDGQHIIYGYARGLSDGQDRVNQLAQLGPAGCMKRRSP